MIEVWRHWNSTSFARQSRPMETSVWTSCIGVLHRDCWRWEKYEKYMFKSTKFTVIVYEKLESECDVMSTAAAISCYAVLRTRCGWDEVFEVFIRQDGKCYSTRCWWLPLRWRNRRTRRNVALACRSVRRAVSMPAEPKSSRKNCEM